MARVSNTEGKRSLNSVISIGRAFAKDVERHSLEVGKKTYVKASRDLRDIERNYLVLLKGHPKHALEIRRRVAENALEQAILHGCTISVCRAKLKAASSLGFESVERKAHFHLLYAKCVLAQGHRRAAMEIAIKIENELELSLKKYNSLLGKQCLRVTREFLRSIEE